MKRLIVNADDFGFTPGVSQAIIDAHACGMVTSTTLIANGESFEPAVEMAHRAPDLGVGVQPNLSQGPPVAAPAKVPSLLNSHGQLHLTSTQLLSRILLSQVVWGEIELELRAQITKIIAAGVSPTHLDGHKHVHVLPGVQDVAIRLAREFGISSVRSPAETLPPGYLLSRLRKPQLGEFKQFGGGRVVSAFARRLGPKLRRAELSHPANRRTSHQESDPEERQIQLRHGADVARAAGSYAIREIKSHGTPSTPNTVASQ